MKKKAVLLSSLLLALNTTSVEAVEYQPMVSNEQYYLDEEKPSVALKDKVAYSEYWKNRQGDTGIAISPRDVEILNAKSRKDEWMTYSLTEFSETISANKLIESIMSASGDFAKPNAIDDWSGTYLAGRPINKESLLESVDNMNITGISATDQNMPIKYAVVTERANMRLLPTEWVLADDGSELQTHYDYLQATALDPAEALLVAWESKDGEYVFAFARNYVGWIKKSSIAYTDRENWLVYASYDSKDTAVVTANKVVVSEGDFTALFQMGAHIPLENDEKGGFSMLLPLRDDDGNLTVLKAQFTENDFLHYGPLDFTRENAIDQAFRFLGDEYGWGGQDDSVDCSSFTSNIYRSMGVEMPRDADDQALFAWKDMKSVSLDGLSYNERLDIMKKMPAGTLMFYKSRSHTLMWLGVDENNRPIAIQSLSSYYADGQKHYYRQVVVSDISYKNSSGVSVLESVDLVSYI